MVFLPSPPPPPPPPQVQGTIMDETRVCVVSVIRAGDALVEAVLESLPGIAVGKID